jgi:hypothetical protein
VADKKRILINAATAAIGGGMLVAIDIIKTISNNDSYSVVLICPPVNVYKKLDVKAEKIFVPAAILKIYSRWWLDFFWLRKKISIVSPHLVITLGNLPAVCSQKQIMYNDNAFVSENSLSGFGLGFKEYLVHNARKIVFVKRLRFVNTLVVQSDHEKKKFESILKKMPAIKVLPPLFPSHLLSGNEGKLDLLDKKYFKYRLGCISYIHGHKNIGILCDVLQLAKQNNFPLQVIFTISPARSVLSLKLKKKLNPFFESGHAVNLGKIRPAQIAGLIQQIDGLILPSLNESYSLNYIEALYLKKILLVSDKLFSHEICKEHARYFNPTNPEDIFKTIRDVFTNETTKQKPVSDLSIENIIPISQPSDLYNIINEELN